MTAGIAIDPEKKEFFVAELEKLGWTIDQVVDGNPVTTLKIKYFGNDQYKKLASDIYLTNQLYKRRN